MPGPVKGELVILGSISYLGGLDVIMKVVTERLDVRNNIVSSLTSQMSREQDYNKLAH
jgi:hypothetical protein